MPNQIPSEHLEQSAVVQYCELRKIPIFAIPNGTYLNGTLLQRVKQMNKLKKEGFKSGVPDLFIPVVNKSYSGLFIEMKRLKESKTSDNQLKWVELLNNQGYLAVVCKGSNEAIKIIKEYIKC